MEHKYKINFHITEHCNYHCEYCFAHFNSVRNNLSISDWKTITDNCVKSGLISEINIAGGEPLVYPHLTELIDYIRSYDIPVSIITNGSLLTDKWLRLNAHKLETIGLSIDSVTRDTLLRTGCYNKSKGVYLTQSDFLHIAKTARKFNPDIKIKINTVITQYNKTEDLSDFINQIKPERWKILKMSVFKNDDFNNSHLGISNNEFNNYVNRQHVQDTIDMIIEHDLKSAYLIVNPEGYLVENFADAYRTVANLTQTPFEKAFENITFDKNLYWSRYNKRGDSNETNKCNQTY